MQESKLAIKLKSESSDTVIGSNLRSIRLSCGMTQSALAEKVGITFQQVQKYEKATNRISASRMIEFANILHVDISAFVRGIDQNMPCGAQMTSIDYDRETQELISLFRTIENKQKQRILLNFIRSMVEI